MSTTFSKSLSLLSTKVTQSSSSLLKKPNNNILHVQKKCQLSSSSFTTTTTNTAANAITTATKNNLTVGALNSSFSKLSFRQFSTEEDKDPDAQWKKFQQTIMYDPTTSPDFETLSKKSKNRGGKMLRKKKEKQEEMMKKQEDRMFDVGTGQFPPLRYSDEETQRLLQEAYAALPQKGISKKTRQKKRQKNRWKLVRRQDRQKKLERIAAHYKKKKKWKNGVDVSRMF